MKIKLGILYGGKSAEHRVSLQTALAVIKAINFEKFEVHPVYITTEGAWYKGEVLNAPVERVEDLEFPEAKQLPPHTVDLSMFQKNGERLIDVVFPLLHGPNGEDGTVQGLLEILNIPYVGNGVLSSSAGMDKVVMKNIFAHARLNQVKYVWFIRREWEADREAVYTRVEKELGYPCFVKPANLGSSVGINKCSNREQLEAAVAEAFQYDRKIIIEEGVTAREIEIGVLGNDNPQCSVVGEIIPKVEFYDYKAKYEDESTSLIIPADVTDEEYALIKEMAVKAFKALDCSGLVRADFFLTKDGVAYINEVNTMPGFTPVSMFPMLWKESGLEYSALIERLIELAFERYHEKQNIKYTY